MIQPLKTPRRLAFVAALFAFMAAFFAHALTVHTYGVEVPFWDQWTAEGDLLLRPWANGQLTWTALIAAWNEHRILFTRLLSIAMYESAGGHWPILATEYVNAALYSAAPALLVGLIFRSGAPRTTKVWMALFIIAISVLPHGWENTIAAFQSQFYFMSLFMIAGLYVAAFKPESALHSICLASIAIASNFTMAPGMVVCPAMITVLLLRAWTGDYPWRVALRDVAILSVVFAASYLTTPKLAASVVLHAQSAGELFRAIALTASWPTESLRFGALVMWAPAIAACWMIFRRRYTDRIDLMMLGMAAWAAVQILGTSYSRGHGMGAVTPRYTDVLAFGLVANLWFAMRLLWTPTRYPVARLVRTLPLYFLVLFVARGYIATWDQTFNYIAERRDSGLVHQAHVQAYLSNGLAAELDQPISELPFPDAAILRRDLDDPAVRAMLIRVAQPPESASNTEASGNR